MINGLLNLGWVNEAVKLFEKMPIRDIVSWNTMMSGYFHNGQAADAIKVFALMIRDCECSLSPLSFSCAMKVCGSLGYIKLARQLHSYVEVFDLLSNMTFQNSVIDMYIKCDNVIAAEKIFLRIPKPSLFCWNSMIYGYSKFYGVEWALDIFTQMPERDDVSWNTMISVLSQQRFGVRTLGVFLEMWDQGFRPSSMTYASVLGACASICDLQWGIHLHARIARMESHLEVIVANGLIDMYVKCGKLGFARQVFNNMIERDTVSWTSLMNGVALYGFREDAFFLFNQMRASTVALDLFTLTTIIRVCPVKEHDLTGEQLHGYVLKSGMSSSTSIKNALITMYARLGDACKASYIFESIPIKDIISWTTMITTYSQAGNIEKARELFYKMPEWTVVTMNSMLAAYVQNGFCEEGLKLYILMRRERLNPDWITFTTSLSACADLAVLKNGTQIVSQAEKLGLGTNVSVANSVVTMYSKCGTIEEAQKAFDLLNDKNLVSWNAIMTGYAQNGQGMKVIEIFDNMLKVGCKPDCISYVSVLSGCSHSGLVIEGKRFFSSMIKDFGVSSTCEHYACMVDLLGRAGLLEQAKNLIDEMCVKPNAAVWVTLLSACRIHSNYKLAEFAVKNLLELDADSRNYSLIANIYSEFGKLEAFADLRRVIKEKGIKKNPGCSWIEVDNRVNVFTVDDTIHPQINEVYGMLEALGCSLSPIDSLCSRGYHSD